MREDGQRTGFILGKTPGAGRILLWDDFEGLFKWTPAAASGYPRLSRSPLAAFGGGYGLLMLGRVRTPNGPMWPSAGRSFPMVREGILRVECEARIPVVGGLIGFGIKVEWWDGVNRYDTRIFYDDEVYYLAWYGGSCSWVDSGLPRVRRAAGAWHRPWMEIDLVRKEYVNVGIDSDTVQLDGNKICSTADAGPVVASVILFSMTAYTLAKKVHFDDVLVRTV